VAINARVGILYNIPCGRSLPPASKLVSVIHRLRREHERLTYLFIRVGHIIWRDGKRHDGSYASWNTTVYSARIRPRFDERALLDYDFAPKLEEIVQRMRDQSSDVHATLFNVELMLVKK